ncbi:MFS transporter [Vibrio sp. WXL103]|uniref:MFS transporter n=1 Tax=Vibrio sp. WXL103 TaxID=3450710 RepID=UPI003EC79E8C
MYRFVLCCFSLVLLYPTAIDLYLVGLSQIAVDLGVNEGQLHMAFSAYLAGMAATMLVAGKLSDSIGRRPVAIIGAIVFTLASLLGGHAENSAMFIGARFMQGIGAGACYVVAFAALRDRLDETMRAKVLSMVNGVTCIVPVLAPVVGHLIMLKFPWQSLFNVMAAMGGLVTALMLLVMQESVVKHVNSQNTMSEGSHNDDESLLQRTFIAPLLITSLGVAVILTYVNVSPMLIMGVLGFDRGGYSSVMAMTALFSMMVSFGAPLLINRVGAVRLMISAQCVFIFAAAVLFVTYYYALSEIGYLLGFALVCCGFSLGFGVAMSRALSPFKARAGVASSMLGLAQVCSGAVYIWLMGWLGANALSMLVTILVIAGLLSLGLIKWSTQERVLNEEVATTA